MQESQKSTERRTVTILVAMSFFAGVFISYYISYISAIFVKVAGVDNLPFAYIVSGVGGTLLTKWFSHQEMRFGFERITTLVVTLIAASLLLVWYACTEYGQIPAVIFFSYAWFWITGNFILLVFWKLPGKLLSFGQTKRLNGIVSSGEVVSAIVAYLSVSLLIKQGIIAHESSLLLISFAGLVVFLLLFSLVCLWYTPVVVQTQMPEKTADEKQPTETFQGLMRTPFFRLLFLSVMTAVVMQSTVDYTVMVVTKEVIKDAKSLTAFFGLLFGCAKVIELLLKTTVSNRLLRYYGVQAGLVTCSLVVGITTIFGLISHAFGAISFLFIAALVNKVMERSLVRSVNTPAINILFQLYTGKLKGIAQNYGDGYGKTYGQLISGLLLFIISLIGGFNLKVGCLNTLVLLCSGVLFYLSFQLVPLYKDALQVRIAKMVRGNDVVDTLGKVGEHQHALVSTSGLPKPWSMLAPNAIKTTDTSDIPRQLLLERFTVATARALALQPDPDKIANLSSQMAGLDAETLSAINPRIQVYWLMIPAFYPRLCHHFSGYSLEVLEMLVKESDPFFRAHRYERPEAQIAMVALRSLLFEKITEANAEKYVALLLTEDSEMLSSLLPILGRSGQRLVSKDTHYYNLLQLFLDTYCQILSMLNTIHQHDCPLLYVAVKQEADMRMAHIIHVLALVHDREIIDNIRAIMANQESDDQVMAIEILELILDDQEKAWLMPIYQESTRAAVLKKLERFFPAAIRTFPDTLEYLTALSPAKLDIIPRYLALEHLVGTGILHYQQAVAACFSKESLIQETAHAALLQLFPAQYAAVAQRTGFVVAAPADGTSVHRTVEVLMTLEVPNYIKSKLQHCLVTDLQGSSTFTVTNPALLGMIFAHYGEYSDTLEKALFSAPLTQHIRNNHEILV